MQIINLLGLPTMHGKAFGLFQIAFLSVNLKKLNNSELPIPTSILTEKRVKPEFIYFTENCSLHIFSCLIS